MKTFVSELKFRIVLISSLLLFTTLVKASEEETNDLLDECDSAPSWELEIDGITRILPRTHCDDQVAFFIDLDPRFARLNNLLSQEQLFLKISKAWRELTNIFNGTDFGDDPQLHVLINNQKRYKKGMATHLQDTYDNSNVIHWGLTNPNVNYKNTLLTELIIDTANLASFIVKEEFESTIQQYSDWQIHQIITYISIENLEYPKIALSYLNRQSEKQQKYPIEGTFLFKNWYLPIYHHYGGREVFERFVEFVFDSEATESTDNDTTISQVSAGQFTYEWSYFVKTDLRSQALIAFGWDDEDETDFQAALEDEEEPTFAAHTPPEQMFLFDNQTLNLTEIHNGLALYFGESLRQDTLKDDFYTPLVKLSFAWRHISTNFESSRSDPFLYMLLKKGSSTNCSTRVKTLETLDWVAYHNSTFLIYCELKLNKGGTIDRHELDSVLETLQNAVLARKGDWYTYPEFRMTDIFVLDVYLQKDLYEDAYLFTKHKSQIYNDDKSLGNQTFWFRDWIYPIYNKPETKIGKIQILQKLLDYPWPERKSNTFNALSIGQLVHIWSMAVGNDLRDLAFSAFGWTDENQKQFELAQKSIPSNYSEVSPLNWFEPAEDWASRWGYHKDRFKRQSFDKHVAIYMNTDFQNNWVQEILSELWKHAKINFGPLSEDPILYIVLHKNEHEKCIISKEKSYWDREFNQRLLIDCGLPSPQTWNLKTTTNLDMLAYGMAILIQRNANLTGNWPANDITYILVYDIYSNLGHTDEADHWKKCYVEKDSRFKQNKAQFSLSASQFKCNDDNEGTTGFYWDPFFFLYMNHGKTEVLKRFISLLQKHWPKENSDYKGKMNKGEILHFWSGAAKKDITANPNFTYGFTSKDFQDIDMAKKTFSGIKYAEIPNETKNDVAIWTSVTAGVILVISATLIAIFRIKIRGMEAQIRSLTSNEIKEFYNGSVRNKNQTTDNIQLDSEPFNKAFEVDRNRLDLDDEAILGSGEYGVVLKGILRMENLPNNRGLTYVDVAVKKPKPNVDIITFKALLSELKVMGHLGKHENVAALIGAVTVNIKNRELLVALEFCAKGDLHAYLKNNRDTFTSLFPQKQETHETQNLYLNMITPTPNKNVEMKHLNSPYMTLESTMSTIDLLDWSYQIASGMAYIASKMVIHGDLAARNVLLTVDNVAKISDFGLSRQLVNYSNYLKTSKTPVPWRWMALESLRDMEFSVQSDVWSFGVTLYEIFSLGAIPYPGCSWTNEFVDQITAGYRLGTPDFGNVELYHIMMDCMKKDPSERPAFDEIENRLLRIKDPIMLSLSTSTKTDAGGPSSVNADLLQTTHV